MMPRKQYISGEYSHRDYYAQFVDKYLLNTIVNNIGGDRILKSKDEHLNDIPLREWDSLQPIIRANGSGGISISDCVCVAKEAAKQYQDLNSK